MNRILAISASLVCVAAAAVMAQPVVTITENVPSSMSYTLTYRSGSCGTNDQLYDVVLSTTSAFTGGTFTIVRGSSCNGLGDVTFSTAGSGLISLEIGSGVAPMRNILSIDGTTTTLPVRIYLVHSVDLGRVEVNRAENVYAHRTLYGPINILNRSGYSIYTIDHLNVGSVGVQGKILGDVINNYGNIGFVQTYADGLIGDVGTRVTFRAANYVDEVYAGTVNANFYGPSGGSAPNFRRLTVEDGDFDGEMRVSTFVNSATLGVYVNNGNLNANIVLAQSLPSSVDIDVSGDLTGQVIINGANNVSYTWAGDVIVGSTTLSTTPHYSQTSASLGGGAVGLVPFNLHGNDCEPVNGDEPCDLPIMEWPSSPVERETLILRHYGPITDSNPTSDLPVIIERRYALCAPAPCSNPWVDITSSCEVLVNPDGKARDLWISMEPDGSGNAQAFDRNYHYRVTPRTYNDGGTTRTDLRSDETFATPDPNVVAYTYQISLFLCLFQMMDIDDDGFITDNDADAWMESPVDVNQDASADMVDYALILEAANGS